MRAYLPWAPLAHDVIHRPQILDMQLASHTGVCVLSATPVNSPDRAPAKRSSAPPAGRQYAKVRDPVSAGRVAMGTGETPVLL